MCRFYLLLAGAVEERQGISIPYPSPTPLLTPGGIRCGGAYLLPRWTGIWIAYIRCRSFIARYESGLAICVRAETACVSVGFIGLRAFVFHWWWDGLFVPAAT